MQKCVKCKRVKEPSQFKTCAVCRERGRQNHMNNRERDNERRKLHHEQNKEHDKERRKHYYEEKKDHLNQQRRTDRAEDPDKYKEQQVRYREKIKDIVITCPVCNYDIKKYKKSQHEKSAFHQDNLARQLNPDMEALPEPDEIKVVDGKEQYYCYACKCCMMCWAWKNHVKKQSHIEAINKRNETVKE